MLPRGADLTNPVLKKQLSTVMKTFIDKVEAIAPTFSAYVQPANQEISTFAQEITGLHFDRRTGTLYHNGVEVESVQLENALDQFLEWLQTHKPEILMAHNCKVFDSYRLYRAFKLCNRSDRLKESIVGFADMCKKKLYFAK